jgi:hypothetical protein
VLGERAVGCDGQPTLCLRLAESLAETYGANLKGLYHLSCAFRCATHYPGNQGKRKRFRRLRQYSFPPRTGATKHFHVYWMHQKFAADKLEAPFFCTVHGTFSFGKTERKCGV